MSKRRAGGAAATRRRGPRTRKQRVAGAAKWLLILGVVGALVVALVGYVVYERTDVPSPNEEFLTQTTKVFYDDGKSELGQFATQERESIPYDEMPQCMKDGVVAAENRTFWTDRGIDPKGILRAAFNNAAGGSTQGASTITQQYVKILYLTQERTLTRKAKEAMLSLKIHRRMSKEEILEGYLNTIYFGRGAYGVQAAAQAFFGVPAKRLGLRQCAVLSSVLNNPTRFDPANGADNRADLLERYRYVLDGMAEMGVISADRAERASRKLPKFPEQTADSQYGGQRGHMLKLVRDELERLDIEGVDDSTIDGGGLRITTTFRPRAMQAVADGVEGQRPPGMNGPNLHVGAASVEVGTGALIGFYGGHDYLDSQINWAVAGGMAGSTFKAFTNVAAIRQGFSLKDTFEGNSPIDIAGTEFENQGDTDYGSSVSMLEATENSVNTAFVDMVDSMDDGPRAVIRAARDLGIPGNRPGRFGIPDRSVDLQDNIGVTLGTAQVSPINMANAYATIAGEGKRAPVHVIEKVTDRHGRVLYEFKAPTKRVLDEDIAADVSYSLQQVVQSGSGTEALALGRPAAGKTGTATNDKGEVSSSWFVGYTPQVSTAVMYVRGTGRQALDEGFLPTSADGKLGYFGGNYPAKTWTSVMQVLMEGRPVIDFPPPVFVDGEAPEEGHAPYVPPPPPETTSQAPEPSPTTSQSSPRPTRTQEPEPTPTPTPTPTPEPEPTDPGSPTDTCGPLGCTEESPTPEKSPSTPPGRDSAQSSRRGRRRRG